MAKFISKCQNQVLCVIPNRVQIVDGIPVHNLGKRIEFYNGEYETSDRQEINFIRRHQLFGVAIIEMEEPKEPPKNAKEGEEDKGDKK